MRISDEITAYILNMLESDGRAELQRNLLAEELGCVPSQITYVLSSRFGPEQGYTVESRRGNGGSVRVTRISMQDTSSPLMHVVGAIGTTLSAAAAMVIVQNLADRQLLPADTARVVLAAVSDQAYRTIDPSRRDLLRASVLKHMLTALA